MPVTTASLPPSLVPSRVSLWPIDGGRYGLDLTYHGPTGYADAEEIQSLLTARGVRAAFRQELDGAWTVRLGPVSAADARTLLTLFVV